MEQLKMDADNRHQPASPTAGRHTDRIVQAYPRRMRITLLSVIMAVSVIGFIFPRGAVSSESRQTAIDQVVESFDIPPTQQFIAPP
ncbi:MAG: hypothetical protein IID15_09575, partial [Candidatus Marinimicrobia bacterium]|nr:hypothetical protein [Candidatus Neomarinimicrobiota bacterium]